MPALVDPLLAAFAEPAPLLAGAEQVRDPIAVLPVLYHLLWRQLLTTDLGRPLQADAVVSVATAVIA